MKKFISLEKLSKKKKRELDKQKRAGWGSFNPVTRKPPNPKAYNRKKANRGKDEPFGDEPFLYDKLKPLFLFKQQHAG